MDIYEPAHVKQLFNQMSGSYERMNFINSFGFSILWRKQFIKKLEKSDNWPYKKDPYFFKEEKVIAGP